MNPSFVTHLLPGLKKALLCLGAAMIVAMPACDQLDTPAEKAARELKAKVLTDLQVPSGRWSWDTEPLSVELREAFLNKAMGNTHMLYASWTVENHSSHMVKDLVVTFSIQAPSGTALRSVSTNTLYVSIPPGASKTFERQPIGAVPVGEGKAGIAVTGFELAD